MDPPVLGVAPVLNGNIRDLERRLSDGLNGVDIEIGKDSVLIYEGMVGDAQLNVLQDVRLIIGNPSEMSDYIKKELNSVKNLWFPAQMFSTGINKKVRIKIYVTKDKDGVFKIMLPKYMGTL